MVNTNEYEQEKLHTLQIRPREVIEGIDVLGNTMVAVELLSEGNATTLILTHSELPTEAALAAHKKGWERCFSGITKFVREPHRRVKSHAHALSRHIG